MTSLLYNPSFWFIVAFFIFVSLAFIKGRKFFTAKIHAGITLITSELTHSKALLKNAEKLLQKNRHQLESATRQSKAILKNAKDELDIMQDDQNTSLESTMQNLEKNALQKIQKAEEDTLKFIKETTLNAALETAKTLLNENYKNPELQALYLNDSLQKLQNTKF